MTKYVPILIMDEDDTPSNNLMSLNDFLKDINFHVEAINAKLEDVFVKITTEDYEDFTGGNHSMGTIEFLVKK